MKKVNGEDLRKWYITKCRDTWLVMPPVITEIPDWYTLGATFMTGDEAHAAFAQATSNISRRDDA